MDDRVKESKILSKKKNHLKFNLKELNEMFSWIMLMNEVVEDMHFPILIFCF